MEPNEAPEPTGLGLVAGIVMFSAALLLLNIWMTRRIARDADITSRNIAGWTSLQNKLQSIDCAPAMYTTVTVTTIGNFPVTTIVTSTATTTATLLAECTTTVTRYLQEVLRP